MIALTMKPSSKGRTVRSSYKMQVSDDMRLTESQESLATELVSEPAGAGYVTCEEKHDFYCY
jgi:hypothetical protein